VLHWPEQAPWRAAAGRWDAWRADRHGAGRG
jgi:hypothetical protein